MQERESELCRVCEERFTSDVIDMDSVGGKRIIFACCGKCRPVTLARLVQEREEMRENLANPLPGLKQGIEDIKAGRTTPWPEVKETLELDEDDAVSMFMHWRAKNGGE